jgi:hypothetical protein
MVNHENINNTTNLKEGDESESKKRLSFIDLLINDDNNYYTYQALKDEVKSFVSAVGISIKCLISA